MKRLWPKATTNDENSQPLPLLRAKQSNLIANLGDCFVADASHNDIKMRASSYFHAKKGKERCAERCL
jgi:hypothetical protein